MLNRPKENLPNSIDNIQDRFLKFYNEFKQKSLVKERNILSQLKNDPQARYLYDLRKSLTLIRHYPEIVMMASDNENERESSESESESDREGGSGENDGSNSTEQFWENFFDGSDNDSDNDNYSSNDYFSSSDNDNYSSSYSESEQESIKEDYDNAVEYGWSSGPGEWFAEREAGIQLQEWKNNSEESYTEDREVEIGSDNNEREAENASESDKPWSEQTNPNTGEVYKYKSEFRIQQSRDRIAERKANREAGKRGSSSSNLFEEGTNPFESSDNPRGERSNRESAIEYIREQFSDRFNSESIRADFEQYVNGFNGSGKGLSKEAIRENIREARVNEIREIFNSTKAQVNESMEAIEREINQAIDNEVESARQELTAQIREQVREEILEQIQLEAKAEFLQERDRIIEEFKQQQTELDNELTARQTFLQEHGQPISQMDHQTLMAVRGDLKESLATTEFEPNSKLQQKFEIQLNLVEKELEYEIAIESLETQKQGIINHHQNKTINNHVQFAGSPMGPYGGNTYRTPNPGTDSDTDYSPDNNPATMGFESWEQYNQALSEIDNEINELEDIIDTNQAAKVDKQYQDQEKKENGEFVETEFTKLGKEIADLRVKNEMNLYRLRRQEQAKLMETLNSEYDSKVQERVQNELQNQEQGINNDYEIDVQGLEDQLNREMDEMLNGIENEEGDYEEYEAELDLEEVMEDNEIERENFYIEKDSSKEYTDAFVDRLRDLGDEEKAEFEKLVGVDLEIILRGETTIGKLGMNVNHRIPPGYLTSNERIKILDRIGISDINAPPIMDLLTATANSGQHNLQWRNETAKARLDNIKQCNKAELTTNQILNIWINVEKGVSYKYELPDAIQPTDYL
jgi:hypothetical protein